MEQLTRMLSREVAAINLAQYEQMGSIPHGPSLSAAPSFGEHFSIIDSTFSKGCIYVGAAIGNILFSCAYSGAVKIAEFQLFNFRRIIIIVQFRKIGPSEKVCAVNIVLYLIQRLLHLITYLKLICYGENLLCINDEKALIVYRSSNINVPLFRYVFLIITIFFYTLLTHISILFTRTFRFIVVIKLSFFYNFVCLEYRCSTVGGIDSNFIWMNGIQTFKLCRFQRSRYALVPAENSRLRSSPKSTYVRI